jgi:hypothetical protein
VLPNPSLAVAEAQNGTTLFYSQEPGMRAALQSLVFAVPMAVSPLVQAESLRCSGGIAAEGDSRLSVVYKCGQPLLKESSCAPVYYSQSDQVVPEPFAGSLVPCQQTDEWLYERGPGNLVATVRFRSGKVSAITYGRAPR